MNSAIRLGKNKGAYLGEAIDIQKVLGELEAAAVKNGWTRDPDFLAYKRLVSEPRKRLYISTGIHGDEPAGPLAGLRLVEDNRWPADVSLWLCPCLNLTGFPLNRRENAQGVDLNRDYRHLATEEIRAHTRWLAAQPNFDLTFCLHEDWESEGFYVYELNQSGGPSFAEKIIDAVAAICPIDRSPMIEDWAAGGGIIRPKVKPEERPRWAEALYLAVNKTRQGYTLEAPSDFPLAVRVQALVTGVQTVMSAI